MSASSLIYAILAGLLPALLWLWFWLREDYQHPEPKSLLIACFIGGMVSVVGAVLLEQWVTTVPAWSDPTIKYTLWALAEELVKFIAVGLIALHTSANDEPIDAMLYCIITALGFAALENILYIMGPISDGLISKAIIGGNMRFIGASLVHVISSASIGFALGYVFYHGKIVKIIAATIGLAVAVFIHASFNISLQSTAPSDVLRTFMWIWAGVVVLIILFEEVKVVRPKLW
jgi:RsiW-degrading membrane proteinase PrsW (M82 family)